MQGFQDKPLCQANKHTYTTYIMVVKKIKRLNNDDKRLENNDKHILSPGRNSHEKAIYASHRQYECKCSLFNWDISVDEIQRIRKKPVVSSQTLAKRHKFCDKTSPKRRLKLKTKSRPADFVGHTHKRWGDTTGRQEATLPVLKNGVLIKICAHFSFFF